MSTLEFERQNIAGSCKQTFHWCQDLTKSCQHLNLKGKTLPVVVNKLFIDVKIRLRVVNVLPFKFKCWQLLVGSWHQWKVCLQQPAMFCLSNSNVDNKNSNLNSHLLYCEVDSLKPGKNQDQKPSQLSIKAYKNF